MSASRSPLKQPPLRQAGQSIHELLIEREETQLAPALLLMVGLPIFTLLLWVYWYFGLSLLQVAVALSAITVAGVPWAWRRQQRITGELRRLKLGCDGERLVGQLLDDAIRPLGYRALHDIVQHDMGGVTFNIDHVLVGPGGVFVIETKTRSKPDLGDPVVEYDGTRVRTPDGPWDEHPIRQAAANAGRIREILERSTGRRDIPIRAVVLFPGWYVQGTSRRRDVWVLNGPAFEKFIRNERPKLSREDVHLYGEALATHARQHAAT